MADLETLDIRAAEDGFEAHYAEKIWALIPETYRHEDGQGDNPGVLRAIVEVMAGQAAVARRSVDRLWADARIEEADDWAVPYIGALVGTRLANALNAAGRRVDVARTIGYRRRIGTVRLLEDLADDLANWDAVASEAFKRLYRFRHGLDPAPPRPSWHPGPITGTPPGGFADLRSPRIDEVVDGPFDDLAHFPEFRRLRGHHGRYNIPKVNLHLFRQEALPLSGPTPVDLGEGRYTLDPSGRDVPLFRPKRRDRGACTPAVEWRVRGPIDCDLLNAATYRLVRETAPTGLEDELSRLYGEVFAGAARLIETADALLTEPPPEGLDLPVLTAAQIEEMLGRAIAPDSPKANLVPGAVSLAVGTSSLAEPFGPGTLRGGNLLEWLGPPPGPRWGDVVVDPMRGRVELTGGAAAADRALYCQRIYYGSFHPVGAGTYERRDGLAREGVVPLPRGPLGPAGEDLSPGPVTGFALPADGVHEFLDSKTYEPTAPAGNILALTGDLVLQAADGTRPYVRMVPDAGGTTLTVTSPGDDTTLVIDGLWLGIVPSGLAPAAAPPPVETRLVLDGTFARVVLRRMTLDPGGERARVDPAQGFAIPFVQLELAGAVDELLIDRCVVGPIVEIAGGVDPCSAALVRICDSIIVSVDGRPAIRTPVASLEIERCTVFGDVEGARLEATDSLFDGELRIDDRQGSCVRFSAIGGPAGIRAYECHFYPGGLPPWLFVSQSFGQPGFAQLAEIAPAEIRRGAENQSEMGAFNRALDPIRRADLAAKLDEYTAINAITQLVIET
ncbi:MAG: hypothetical protein ACFB13_00060 [Kiloniellaceae bacterium]